MSASARAERLMGVAEHVKGDVMRTLRPRLVGLGILLLLLGGQPATVSAQVAEPAPAIAAERSLEYTTDGRGVLDVFAPSGPGPWPVVVIVPGSYQGRGSYEFLAEAIASEGAVVYNISAATTPPLTDATRQVACAVRFARATAADHGGDPTSVTLVGHSAGAAIGMVVALAGDDYARDCVVSEGSALLDALVGYEGPFDLATAGPFDPGSTDYGSVNFFDLQEEDPDLWRAVNPYAHVGGNLDLVVRLVHGDDAGTAWYDVPLEISLDLDRALREAGYDTEVTIVEGAGHSAMQQPWTDAIDVIVQHALHSTE